MTTSNPSDSLHVDDVLSIQLSKRQFGRLISYLDTLRRFVKDETLEKKIGQLMRELVEELSPNQQAAMIRFYLDINKQDAASFLEVQKPTRSKPNETL